MSQKIEYDELKLRFEPTVTDSYRVIASSPDGTTVSGNFRPPFTETELENFVLKVGLYRRQVRRADSSKMDQARRFGESLAQELLKEDVGELFSSMRHISDQREDRGIRISLALGSAPELMSIPWEFLYRDRSFISQSIFTPIVRSLDLRLTRPTKPVTGPLRIVAFASGPLGHRILDAQKERAKLERALDSLIAAGRVSIQWLDHATTTKLHQCLSAPEEEHVLHYIGHGGYDEHSGEGALLLETEDGGTNMVTGQKLASIVQDERSLRLAVLNACEGARSSHQDPFSGVAASLLHAGIPAVVGMQFEITDEAAITLSEQFYTALANGLPVDAALAQARTAIFARSYETEFGTPVLFLRGENTHLFHLDENQIPSAAAREHRPEEPEPPEAIATARQPVGDRVTAGENRELLIPALGQVGGTIHRRQRELLTAGLEDGEHLLGVCRGAFPNDLLRNVILLFTSQRLFWVRETAFSSATSGSVRWADVETVAAASADTLEIFPRQGEPLHVRNLDGFGVFLGDSNLAFGATELASAIKAGLDKPLVKPNWTAELVAHGDGLRRVRVQLDEEHHDIGYQTGTWYDQVTVDGVTVHKPSAQSPGGHEVGLTDGAHGMRMGRVKVRVSLGGKKILAFALTVDGWLLFHQQ